MRAFGLVLLLITAPVLAGCIGAGDELEQNALGLAQDAYDTSRGWSMPTTPALYPLLDGVKAMVPSFDGVEIAIGIFRPDIAGCDWEADALPAECHLPIVIDAGPYYLNAVDQDKYRPPTIEWLVPRGFAVVQLSLRGTGESGGCMQFKNPSDVEDISAVVDVLAAEPWSNGNVGMIGRSYDGTSAWAGAASGNEHIRTIVPISGAVDGPWLYYKNGTTEQRGLVQPAGYYPFYALGLAAGDPSYRTGSWTANVCPELVDDWTQGPLSAITGDASSAYWQNRDLTQRIVDDYNGSIWVIHGMEDWNVNPSQAVPFIRELHDAGIPTLGWLGQWAHAYPDRIDEHRNVRWDWADRVVAWFDFYLKGEGDQPRLGVEVEDSLYVWRWEETYPPRDSVPFELELGAGGELTPLGDAEAGSFVLTGPPTGIPLSAIGTRSLGSGGSHATFTSGPLMSALRIAGLPQLHVTVTPTTPHGGNIYAELYELFPDGRSVRLSWAAMNLRYHAGGNTEGATLTPGEPVLATMQFEPTDAHIGEGHRLRVVLHKAGVEDVMPSPTPEASELVLGGEASILRLPWVDRPALLEGYRAPGLGPSPHKAS